MIQIATTKLTIADNDGRPVLLDIGLLERHLGEAFRSCGYSDAWVVEDIALSITEKVRESDATLIQRSQIARMVDTLLNALGYADVAAEYARITGSAPFEDVRRGMRRWHQEEIAEYLSKSMPLTGKQLEKVAPRCAKALESLQLELASPKLLLDLATHIIANEGPGATAAERKPGVSSTWELAGVPEETLAWVTGGVLNPLPSSRILPKARLALNFPLMVRQFPDWWLPMSLDAAIGTIAAPVRDLLSSMHEELSRLYPLLEDSPVHLIVQDCISTLEKDPRLWKKRNREEIVTLLDETLRNKVASCLPFSTAISVK